MSPQALIDDNINVLSSGAAILELINDVEYNHIATSCFSASTGKHFRHILDHYFCFFSGLEKHDLDYDARIRETSIESDRADALRAIKQIIAQLKQLKLTLENKRVGDDEMVLEVRISTSVRESTQSVTSTLARELVFLHGHTTHHYAIIAAILKLQNISVEHAFGIAPSTLAYEEQTPKCAP